jgi:hypothetical protein
MTAECRQILLVVAWKMNARYLSAAQPAFRWSASLILNAGANKLS